MQLRHAFRVLRRDPGFTVVAVCSLSLGIGAASAMFSLADAFLLRPLPVAKPDRVVTINAGATESFGANTALSDADYVNLRDRSRSFRRLAACSPATLGFSPGRKTLPKMAFGTFVSGNFLHWRRPQRSK